MKGNKVKKPVIFVLTLVLMLLVAGCKSSKQEETVAETSTVEDSTEEKESEETKKETEKETKPVETQSETPEETEAPETDQETDASTGTWRDHFEQSGTMYYTTITSGTPVQGGGLSIIVDTSDASVTYTITDAAGNETVEYLFVNYSSGQVERYQYVSAMGEGFYYYCDLNGNGLSLFNVDGEDRTAGAQETGHYDPAVESTKAMISSYSSYFTSAFGISPDQAARNN